ncbi:hypothetical protein BHU72_02885 [Desulfuribacillus stibiiarsenatis]|uniref:PilZ domain-containing protein n=1 Tax=Desulfuribacillus stibiiarsenatis TaxID=1390249 RepID=A0A1E5L700_9FIRM|nr:PilZ domain-containing protein [Desulfuribacillus stibiiarsenatis]OEH85743.1 hypothetical protein BHU72_02885 [Desulfuribacillus stibiiarsenatis]
MERRRLDRFGMNIPVMLEVHQWEGDGSFKGQKIEGILSDISEKGLGIISKYPLAIEMFVQITIVNEEQILPLIGKIIRIEILEPNEQFKYGCILSGTSLSRQLALQDYIHNKFGA